MANTHLDHLEDRMILYGAKGGEEAVELLELMEDFLDGKGGPNLKITTKWDGAPAVVAGTDPATKKFFVGTKSVFAKNPKRMTSESDIQREYDGALAQKLSTCLRYLPEVIKPGVILQGDLLFTDDKRIESINKQRLITFRPNTITYAVNPSTPLGHEINVAKMGIVFHTKYDDMMRPSFNISPTDFRKTVSCWAEKAEFTDISGAAAMSGSEKSKYNSYVKMAKGSLSKCKKLLDKIQSGKKTLQLDTEYLKFFNGYVKEGRAIPSSSKAVKEYMFHLGKEYDKVIAKNKTLKAQADKAGKFIEQIDFIMNNENEFRMMTATFMSMQAAKNILVRSMNKVGSLQLFVDKGGGNYEVTTPEGFVAVQGDKATKLIDRFEFSRLNFTVEKQW